MRGFGFREHGGLDRLEFVELPTPVPGPEEVRIRVRAAAFNRLDRFTLAGIPGVTVERPHALGSDAAGEVDLIGDDVRDLSVGDRVLVNPGLWDGVCSACLRGEEALCRGFRIVGEHVQGSAAEFLVVPRRNLHRLPPPMNYAQGAAAPLVFQTAWRALRSVGGVGPGQRVAVIGSGGGVATAAVQVAKLLGASVAVAARSAARAAEVRALGADALLPFDESNPLDRVLWAWSEKQGVDVIFDSVGAPTLPRSLRAVARGGRVVVIGATAGPEVLLDVRTLFWRQASIRGSTMANAREFDEVYGHLAAGHLRAVVDSEHPFDRALEAFRRFDTGAPFGKVVLRGPGA